MRPHPSTRIARIIAALTFSSLAFAANPSADGLEMIGFSRDGRALAFLQAGTGDGMGGGFAHVYFIDVPANAYAAAPVHVQESAELTQTAAAQRAMQAAEPMLRKLKIEKGNTGKLLYSGPLEGRCESYLQSVKHETTIPEGATFRLKELPLPKQTCETKTGPVPALGFSLEVSGGLSGAKRLLHVDKRVPRSRGCPLGYHLRGIYEYADHLAVLIDVLTPGFEACPAIDIIAVTAPAK